MPKLEVDEEFELHTKRWTELINLRQTLTGHKMDPTGIDVAIANVFDSKKGHVIDSIIVESKELMAMISKLQELQIDSTYVKMALAEAVVPGASGMYAAGLVKLRGMIKMREQMRLVGVPTGCIEATIAGIFKPASVPAPTVQLEEASEASVVEQFPRAEETIEPANLDASATAIFKQSSAEIEKRVEPATSETVVDIQSSLDTKAGNAVEYPPQPAETSLVSNGAGPDELAVIPSLSSVSKSLSLDAEHITTIETSSEAMDVGSSSAAPAPPLTETSSLLTSPSTVCSSSSTETASRLTSLPSTLPKVSAKRSSPTDTALGSALNPICLGSSPTPKRRRTTRNMLPKGTLRNYESWKMPIHFVGTMGLRLKPRQVNTKLTIVFDDETQRIVFYHGQISLTALYSNLEINPETLLTITRPNYTQSKDLKIRFMGLDTNAEETFVDIMVATKQECRELIARIRALTSLSEILLPELGMNKLFKDATWVVDETRIVVGLSVAKTSRTVWLE